MYFAFDWTGPSRVYALSDLAAITELDAAAVATALALLQTAGLVTTVTAAGQVTVRTLTV